MACNPLQEVEMGIERGKRKAVVVTDLDGTLLDHHDYSYEAVLPVLERLQEEGIPVVANTSKTRAEWLAMRDDFKNSSPFIVENGSALYSGDEAIVFGKPRIEILATLAPMKNRFDFIGYADVGLETICEWTGLGQESATLSAEREYSEPLRWLDSEEQKRIFCEELESLGYQTLQGGRFLHVLGMTDKATPLSYFRKSQSFIIALGDRQNDLAMLTEADIGIVINTPDGIQIEGGQFLRSKLVGPRGWAEMMTQVLDQLL